MAGLRHQGTISTNCRCRSEKDTFEGLITRARKGASICTVDSYKARIKAPAVPKGALATGGGASGS